MTINHTFSYLLVMIVSWVKTTSDDEDTSYEVVVPWRLSPWYFNKRLAVNYWAIRVAAGTLQAVSGGWSRPSFVVHFRWASVVYILISILLISALLNSDFFILLFLPFRGFSLSLSFHLWSLRASLLSVNSLWLFSASHPKLIKIHKHVWLLEHWPPAETSCFLYSDGRNAVRLGSNTNLCPTISGSVVPMAVCGLMINWHRFRGQTGVWRRSDFGSSHLFIIDEGAESAWINVPIRFRNSGNLWNKSGDEYSTLADKSEQFWNHRTWVL